MRAASRSEFTVQMLLVLSCEFSAWLNSYLVSAKGYLPRMASFQCADRVRVSSYLSRSISAVFGVVTLQTVGIVHAGSSCAVALSWLASARQVSGPCRSRFKLLRSPSLESLDSEGLKTSGCSRCCLDFVSGCINNLEWLAGLLNLAFCPVVASISLLAS